MNKHSTPRFHGTMRPTRAFGRPGRIRTTHWCTLTPWRWCAIALIGIVGSCVVALLRQLWLVLP